MFILICVRPKPRYLGSFDTLESAQHAAVATAFNNGVTKVWIFDKEGNLVGEGGRDE